MTSASSEAIIKEVEAGLRSLFPDALILKSSDLPDESDLLAKAKATNDPALAKGYRKLAKKAARKARKVRGGD